MRKILWGIFLIVVWASFSLAQQTPSPRKADAQFHADYQRAKKLNQSITDDTTDAAAKLEKKTKPKRVELEGLADELQAAMRKACADVPQGCHYDEALDMFIPNPAPATSPKQDEKK